MIGNEVKRARGVISPGVPAEALRRAWAARLEAGLAPEEKRLETDGQNFTLWHRTTWQKEGMRHAFLMVVQQVSNLEADRVGRHKVEPKIEWSE